METHPHRQIPLISNYTCTFEGHYTWYHVSGFQTHHHHIRAARSALHLFPQTILSSCRSLGGAGWFGQIPAFWFYLWFCFEAGSHTWGFARTRLVSLLPINQIMSVVCTVHLCGPNSIDQDTTSVMGLLQIVNLVPYQAGRQVRGVPYVSPVPLMAQA